MKRRDIAQLFEDEFGPWRVRCRVRSGGRVVGTITWREGRWRRRAGRFEYTVAGRTIAYNDITIRDRYRGRGFTDEWTRRCIERYRAGGYDEVTILTTSRDGGWYWARHGFAPTSLVGLERIIAYAATRADRLDQAGRARWASLLERDVLAQEIWYTGQAAAFVQELSRLTCHNGERLLYNCHWNAALKLGP